MPSTSKPTGTYNSAQGYNALNSNTTAATTPRRGTELVIYQRRFDANAASSSSVYLGANTEAKASGDTNENVIGNGAVGNAATQRQSETRPRLAHTSTAYSIKTAHFNGHQRIVLSTVAAGSETLGSPLLPASGGTGATTTSGALVNLGAAPAFTLTTTGTSGAATYSGNVLISRNTREVSQ